MMETTMQIKLTPNDFRLGALYRIARARRMDRLTVRSLTVSRCGLSEKSAEQLSLHWAGSFAAYWRHAA